MISSFLCRKTKHFTFPECRKHPCALKWVPVLQAGHRSRQTSPEPPQDASAQHEISAMKCLVDGSVWWMMSSAKNRDRLADYVDELADKAQQKWRMAWVSEINGQYKNDTSWTEEIIQLLPFFQAHSLRHCNLTEKQRRVIQINHARKWFSFPSFFSFFFFPF